MNRRHRRAEGIFSQRRTPMKHVVALCVVVALASQPALHAAQSTPVDPYDVQRALLIGTAVVLTVVAIVGGLVSLHNRASSPNAIRATMNPWVGRNVNALIGEWGAPSVVFPTPDGTSTIYTWIYQGGARLTTPAPAGDSPSCRVDWTANAAHVIQSYRWDGSCRVETRKGGQLTARGK